jgi:CO/xanthine dehydrogenase FAD-binding subunit
MKPASFDLRVVDSVAEAVAALAEVGDEGRPLAGGQSLIPLLNFRMSQPEVLIDLGDVDELRYIEREDDGGLRIGAMTTMSQLLRSPDVALSHPIVVETVRNVAHEPIRNRGTIGGSLAHLDPAAEMPALALLLDMELVATSAKGTRRIAAADFIHGAYVSDLAEGELLTEIRIPPLAHGSHGAVLEIAQRAGDFALAGAACVLATDASQVITSMDLVVFGSSTSPTRLRDVDQSSVGQMISTDLILELASAYADGITPLDDRHGSGAYRRHLTRVMATRAVRQAAGMPLS